MNLDIFIRRLIEIMDNHQLNAAAFAEKIGVQRSSVSHILSKRNKPSLDFILKIHNTFDEVTLDWLLLDKKEGPSPLLVKTKNDKSLMLNPDESSKIYDIEKANENVIQIVQLYKDGSFRSFSPKS
ncbi:MAG: helix-turn-helix domain-containing protein [Flavobacteriaceae bacterium]